MPFAAAVRLLLLAADTAAAGEKKTHLKKGFVGQFYNLKSF